MNRVLRGRIRDEAGSALASVIGLLAVSLVIAAVITASAVQALRFTSTARASTQSQAAADAGIDVMYAQLKAGTCQPTIPVSAPPLTVTVSYSTSSSGNTWVDACPTPAAVRVRIQSTGRATNDAATTSKSEAIYNWNPPATTGFTGGPAIYAYSAAGFGGSGHLVSVTGSSDVMVKTGDVTCDGASTGADDLVVDGGKLTLTGSCNVSGNLWVSKALTVEGAVQVGGNAVADSIAIPGSGRIAKAVWATNGLRLDGSGAVGGEATAASLIMTGSTSIRGSAWIYGSTKMDSSPNIAKDLTTKTFSTANSNVKSSVSGVLNVIARGPGPGPTPPTKPSVPNWVDFTFTSSDWTGYDQVVLASSACTAAALNTEIAKHAGRNLVLDARACSSVTVGGVDKVNLGGNLVIFAKSYSFGGSGGFASSANRKLWLITPDETADGVPSCPAGQQFDIGGSFTIPNAISTMIYSPCLVSLGSSLTVTGQIFAGRADIDGAATLRTVTIGLPGVDLDTGSTAPAGGSAAGSIGAPISSREVAAG